MHDSVRTPCGSIPRSRQRLPGRRLVSSIACFLAIVVGSLAESACAGSESSIRSATPALQSETSVAIDLKAKWAADGSFRTLECNAQPESALIRSVGEPLPIATWNFVIAHGLGGTVPGDRFCQLALEIKRTNPDANVLLIDWLSTATQTSYGFPRVWHIAGCLDAIAADAATSLSSLKFDPDQTTLIGESFGVYVQGQIAKALGGVRHILAFNPASEAGGYEPADLCKYSQRAWSFHTFCVYDTTLQIAHADFLLETPEEASLLAQHTHGIPWLTRLLRDDNLSWLMLNKSVAPARAAAFGGIARENGEIDPTAIPRIRPRDHDESTVPEDSSSESLVASFQMEGISK